MDKLPYVIVDKNILKSRKLILIFLLHCAFYQLHAQVTLSGSVRDTANKPLALVSVILLEDLVFKAGTSTDERGSFQLTYTNEPGRNYQLRVSLAGYHSLSQPFTFPDTGFLRRLILQEDSRLLREVTVNARKPLVTRRSDRYIVNVENSFLANGNSGLDVLQRSPGIWVDGKGTIRIKGTQSVMVMINDVVQRMSDEELAEYLRSLKSEDISKIEIIHNPPAEFEAAGSGGIVHIILKRERRDGLNGSVNVQYRQQGKRSYLNGASSINLKMKNIYLAGSGTISKDDRYVFEKARIRYPANDMYSSMTDRSEKSKNAQYRLGLIYELNANHSIGIQSVLSNGKYPQYFLSNEAYQISGQSSTGFADVDKDRRSTQTSTTLNYIWRIDSSGSSFKLVADHTYIDRKEFNDFNGVYSDPAKNFINRNKVSFVTTAYSLQADYKQVFGLKTTLTAGAKSVSIRRNSLLFAENFDANTWIMDAGKSNNFIYTENLFMLYSSLEQTIRHTTIKLGLRSEHTNSTGNAITLGRRFRKNYPGLFPSVFLLQTLDERSGRAVYINYSRRIKRPALSELNPARIEYSNYTAMKGNPQLMPEYAHNFAIGYKFSNDLSADIYIARTVDAILLSANSGNDISIDYIPENVGRTTEYGLNFSAAFEVVKGWQMNSNVAVNHSSYLFNQLPYRQTSCDLRSVQTIALKRVMDVDLVVAYRSPYVYTNLRNPSLFYLDLGFSRKILKGKGQLRLYFTDLFNTVREKELTEEKDTRIDFYRKRPTQTVSISLRYNFSSGKLFNARKTDQVSGEEKNRIGN